MLEPDMLFGDVYTGKVTSLPLFEIPLFIDSSTEFLAQNQNGKSLSAFYTWPKVLLWSINISQFIHLVKISN